MAGYRSYLAFWAGGASGVTPTTSGSVKSLLAPWVGGAAATTPPAVSGGYKSLLTFWCGGSFSGPELPPVVEPPVVSGGGTNYTWRYDRHKKKFIKEEEEIMAVITAFLHTRR